MRKLLLFIVLQVVLLSSVWAGNPFNIVAIDGLPEAVNQDQTYHLHYQLQNAVTQTIPYHIDTLSASGVTLDMTKTTCNIDINGQLAVNGNCDLFIDFNTVGLPIGAYEQPVLSIHSIGGALPLIFSTTINPPASVPVYTQISGLPDDSVSVSITANDNAGHSYAHAQTNGTNSFDNMVPSSYTVTAATYSAGGYTYVPTVSNPYTIDSSHQYINITYTAEINPVTMNTNITGLPPGAQVNISATDGTHNYGPHAQGEGSQSFDTMLPGSYTVTAPDYSDSGYTYVPTLSNPYTIDTNHTVINITYTAEANPVSVSTVISGLPDGAMVNISATDGTHSYGPHAQSNGTQAFDSMLPGSYTVNAPTYSDGGVTYVPTATNPYQIDSNHTTLTITYSAQNIATSTVISGLPAGTTANISATDGPHVYGPHAQANGGQAFDTMVPGSYTVTSNSPVVDGTTYVPTLSNPYKIDDMHQTIAITYTAQVNPVAVTTTISGLPDSILVNVSATDGAGHNYGPHQQANGSQSFDTMIPGSYTITAASYNSGEYTYVPTLSNPYSIDNTHTVITIAYQQEVNPVAVSTQISGLPGGATVAVSATYGSHSYGPHAQANGSQSFDTMVPGSYTVTAANYVSGGDTYQPTLSNPYTINAANPYIAIPYTKVTPGTGVVVHFTVSGLPSSITSVSKVLLFNTTNSYQANNAAVDGTDFPTRVMSGTYYYAGSHVEDASNGKVYCTPSAPSVEITSSPDPQNITINYSDCTPATMVPITNEIYYHLYLPPALDSGVSENIPLSGDYKFMVITNYVAGAVSVHMLKQHNPALHYNADYVYGTLLAQLLQENNNLHTFASAYANENINIEPEYSQLLAVGQGGPYQINDYSKRLPGPKSSDFPNAVGLINFVALQKSLGYTIADQDNGTQTGRRGPASLENVYFGPLAAAYFYYNDYLRVEEEANTTWYVNRNDWHACVANLNSGQADFIDVILNFIYNAGDYSPDFTSGLQACAHAADYPVRADNVDNYGLNDNLYSTLLPGMEKATTFILYPRQVRLYLDELYNNTDRLTAAGMTQVNNNLVLNMSDIRVTFSKSMQTLAYVAAGSNYQNYTQTQANAAFDSALASTGLTISSTIAMNNAAQRTQFYALLDQALTNLETATNSQLNATTETNWGSAS